MQPVQDMHMQALITLSSVLKYRCIVLKFACQEGKEKKCTTAFGFLSVSGKGNDRKTITCT